MDRLKPYRNWTRVQLFDALKLNALPYGFNIDHLRVAVFDDRWNPSEDFDGCTIVSDNLHPDPSCFMHDYARIVLEGGYKYEKQFREDMLLLGYSKSMANRRFFAVTLHWFLWAKWKKRRSKSVKIICF